MTHQIHMLFDRSKSKSLEVISFAYWAEKKTTTAVVATYLANRRLLTICNAGHPRPFWHRAATGRWDFYYTLTSVALLSIAAAGVWLTFYIGRINIGQGAYALAGGYVSTILMTQGGVSFWLTLKSSCR